MAFDEPTNKIFVYGGQTAGAGVSSENWVYDVMARSWTQLNPPRAPGARTNMAFAITGRTMYVFGGIDSAGALLGDLWAFDMSSSTWNRHVWDSPAAVSPPPLQHASLVAVNSTMLALYGGTLQGGAYSATLYKYDIPTSSWSIHKAPGESRLPPAERMRAVAVDKRRVLFTGGLTAQGLSNTTWVWKLDENVFDPSAYGPLPAGLHSHSLVTFNQSAHAGACVWDPIPIFTLCTKQTVPAVVAISGVTNRPGGGLLVSWAHSDPLPPPVGKLDIGLRLAMVSFNAIGLATALSLILFTVKHQKVPVVKAANPNLSIISLIGAAMVHLGIMTSSSIDEGRTAMMLTAFLLGGGYTLIFAAIMVKNGLIYFIFASKTRFKVRTMHLLFICAFALGLQSLLVALWFRFDTNPIVTLTVAGVKWTINAYNQSWLILCAMPVVILTVFSVFVSYKIRHVRSDFNETQYVAIATYLIAMALLVITPVMLLLDSPLVQYIITTVLVTMTTMAVQGLFFANKVSAVYVKTFTTDNQVGAISLTPSGLQQGTTSGVTASSNVSETSNASTASGGPSDDAGGLWCKYCKQKIRVAGGSRHSSSHKPGKKLSEVGGKGATRTRELSTLSPTGR
ncbi:hypothetical protein BCR44DRAFT_33475 [Catenaria anguillulae PL171]|uniref:G-protein coupled receptors family 3 profile domain-containing protein n=1 Tax=Catenaria anguillulae PL171 TaxID=765915 RepID=A0A1Y2H8U8_9FUNG|nr:hypothetical protein BCR44DRAFT_33475 [Catenaria anguillulae PL171]